MDSSHIQIRFYKVVFRYKLAPDDKHKICLNKLLYNHVLNDCEALKNFEKISKKKKKKKLARRAPLCAAEVYSSQIPNTTCHI